MNMKQGFIDHINFIARDIPPGAVNSSGLEDDVIVLYNQYMNEHTEHEIILEHACFIATKKRIEKYIEKQSILHQQLPLTKIGKLVPDQQFQSKYTPRLPSILEHEHTSPYNHHVFLQGEPHLPVSQAVPLPHQLSQLQSDQSDQWWQGQISHHHVLGKPSEQDGAHCPST
jgi:hypothetical protein